MRNILLIAVALLVATSFLFAEQPKLVDAKIEPTTASAGDSVKIVVEFTGKKDDLKKVFLTVREYPDEGPTIYLKPCEDCKKNVWEMAQRVPWDAPAETFHLDITAVDKDGKEVVTKGFENNYTGKAGSVTLKVTW